MWKNKQLKKSAKKILKNNFWTIALIGIFMTFIIGEYTIGKDSFENLKIFSSEVLTGKNVEDNNELTTEEEKNKSNQEIINQYGDKLMSQLLYGDVTGLINSYNKENNVYKGAFYAIFKTISKGQTQLQNLVESIDDYSQKMRVQTFLVIIVSLVGLLVKILITNPLTVGERRVYLESANYKQTRIKRMTYVFKKGRYWSVVKTIVRMDIYKFLWQLTIIGGIIKNFSYKMVPYIIAENPSIKSKDAIKMSREMMNGNKMHAFGLYCSFLKWYLLEAITFGLAAIYVVPYVRTTYTKLYEVLREDYIKNKKFNYEQLNDEKLFDENLSKLEKYPDEDNQKEVKRDYNKNYEITSIILFFFIFAFVGWVWEVTLFLFRDGKFINRGAMYGPWLPIYGVGCTLVILLTKFKAFKKILKKPLATFFLVMILCAIIEYFTAWYIEVKSGVKYWDYTGVFCNLQGRICLEGTLFFGIGGCVCLYIVAPFLERIIQKLTLKIKLLICTGLILLFTTDAVFSHIYPHTGDGITNSGKEIIINDK